jgi:hypothetical protein
MPVVSSGLRLVEREETHLDVSMARKVEHGEAAHVPEPVDVNGELAEEVDERGRAAREREPEHERREEHTRKLLHVQRGLRHEQLAERGVRGARVRRRTPRLGQVVRVRCELLQERAGVEDAVLVRYERARARDDGAEEGDVEEHGPVRGDLEVEEQVRVEHGRKDEHRRKRARDERDEAAGRTSAGACRRARKGGQTA